MVIADAEKVGPEDGERPEAKESSIARTQGLTGREGDLRASGADA